MLQKSSAVESLAEYNGFMFDLSTQYISKLFDTKSLS